jgi:hypothetical protein
MTTPNFHAKSTALEVVKGLNAKLDGKVAIITGATSGKQVKLDEYYKKLFDHLKVLVLKQHVH